MSEESPLSPNVKDSPSPNENTERKGRSRNTNTTFLQAQPRQDGLLSPRGSSDKPILSPRSPFKEPIKEPIKEPTKETTSKEMLKSGFMDKLGEKVKNWQTRFLVLYNTGEIEYFKGVKEKVEGSGQYDFSKAEKKGAFPIKNCNFKYEKLKGHDYCLIIETESRDFTISFLTEEVLQDWKKVFREAGANYILPNQITQKVPPKDVKYYGFAQKMGEKVKKWTERYFVLYQNGDLEYYKGVKYPSFSQDFADLKAGKLKGKLNIHGKYFKLPNDYAVVIELEERDFFISFDDVTVQTKWKKVFEDVGAEFYDVKKRFTGLAEKLGEKTKKWQERYFVIMPNGEFEYYSGVKNDDVTKGDLKGKYNVKGRKFKQIKGVKDHEFVICIEFQDRDFLVSLKSSQILLEWKTHLSNSGAIYYDPSNPNKIQKPVNSIALELLQRKAKKDDSLPTIINENEERKELRFGHTNKLGEKSQKWQERYFVLWNNGDLEYYKGIRYHSTDLADLSQAELKGKINIKGLRIRVPREIINVSSPWYQLHIELYERDLILSFRTPEILADWKKDFQKVGGLLVDEKITISAFDYAFKLGEKVKSWQERYMILFSNGDLEYFKDVPTPQNETDMAEFKKGSHKGTFNVYSCRFKFYEEKENGLEIELKNGRLLCIAFKTKDQMMKWRSALSDIGAAFYDPKVTVELSERLQLGPKKPFFGFADKLGEKIKNWQNRYFILNFDSTLDYYKGVKNSKNPKEMADIRKAELKGKVDIKGCDYKVSGDTFTLYLKSKREFVLSFKDSDVSNDFQKAIMNIGCVLVE